MPVVIIVSIPEQRTYDLLEPRASLVITDRPAVPETRTHPGFRILADAQSR